MVMRVHRPSWAGCRVAVAVAALYALVLQAFLGSIAVTPTLDPAHVLCVADAGTGEGPSKPHPNHCQMLCCTVAHGLGTAEPSLPVAIDIVWPERKAVEATWRPEIVAAPRAPPGISASARAPPAA